MENFAEYILNEKNSIKKMYIAYNFLKDNNLFFDKVVVLKTEIARMFVEYSKLDVDENFVITVMLLCNCKKVDDLQKIGKFETFAKEGAECLKRFGFSDKFCKVCEELNRYSGSMPREKESDIIEIVDQFSGLLLRRPEREPFTPDEALVIIEERNLKGKDNKYIQEFKNFVNEMEEKRIRETIDVPVIKKLVRVCDWEVDAKEFIKTLNNKYENKIVELLNLKQNGKFFIHNVKNKYKVFEKNVKFISGGLNNNFINV